MPGSPIRSPGIRGSSSFGTRTWPPIRLHEFRALYDRLDGVTFNRSAEATVRSGCLAGPAQRAVPWGRVGLGRTAFQPMQSQANAWAWRDRLSDAHIAEIIESTRDVAERFYTPSEIEGRPAAVPGVGETASAVRPAFAGRHRWRSA